LKVNAPPLVDDIAHLVPEPGCGEICAHADLSI
jgi:hypothetical protein